MAMTVAVRAAYYETGLGWPDAMAPAGPDRTTGAGEREQAGWAQASGGAPLDAGLGFRLGRAHRLLRGAWEAVITDLGLSPPQAALLRAVAQRPECGLRELARRMQTDAMNAKRLADQLEQAGLVSSSSDPGHRQRRVLRPTSPGAVLAAELARRAARHQEALARVIGPAEVTELLSLLDHVESVLAPALPPGPAAGEATGWLQEKGES